MYIQNRRNSGKFKGCSPLQSCNGLISLKPTIAYFAYTYRWLCNRTPADRWGNPEELIGALIYLASNASSYINGQIIYVDGGLRRVFKNTNK